MHKNINFVFFKKPSTKRHCHTINVAKYAIRQTAHPVHEHAFASVGQAESWLKTSSRRGYKISSEDVFAYGKVLDRERKIVESRVRTNVVESRYEFSYGV
jgi:hypothetical protein